jgi:hypothetical protein
MVLAMKAGCSGQRMEGTMLATICFTFVIVAMAFPGLILLAWPEVAFEPENVDRKLSHQL